MTSILNTEKDHKKIKNLLLIKSSKVNTESEHNKMASTLNTLEEFNAIRIVLLMRLDCQIAKELNKQDPKPSPKPYSPVELT